MDALCARAAVGSEREANVHWSTSPERNSCLSQL